MEKEKKGKIVCRFAPSPTGFFHIGGARTALFNYLFAKHNNGELFLRIEDTDRERSRPEYEKDIIENLKWLGISFNNEELIRQSERLPIYKKYLEKLIKEEKAYVSKESAKKKSDRGEVVRFKNPNERVKFQDLIRGEVVFDTAELGDFVIAKNLDEPLFHFAVVIDDFEMSVTYVIRGEDHISNTPRQILIQEAMGAPRPAYAHIPLILASDRTKLSKRHGAVSVEEYRQEGYLPEALVNYLALLGWNPGGNREIFSLEELAKIFDLKRVQKGGAVFDTEKLRWINKEYIKSMPKDILNETALKRLSPEYRDALPVKRILPNILSRISVFKDLDEIAAEGELQYLISPPQLQKKEIPWKEDKDVQLTLRHLKNSVVIISEMGDNDENFTVSKIKEELMPYAEKEGKGNVLWPIRYALSGLLKSPDPFSIASALGKKETLARLQKAASLLQK